MHKITPIGFPNLHYGLLRKCCQLKPSVLAKKYGLKEIQGSRGRHWFKDNGADILAVAHLDSRIHFQHFTIAQGKPDTLIYCQTLDDRLGAYLILEWLQTANLKYDILLTENEEKSLSTAADFIPPEGKKYNWMFSLDRSGTDVVTYQYGTEALNKALTESGVENIRYGNYSDIVELEHLDIAGVNFGVGYYNNHGLWAYASKNDILAQLRTFVAFYKRNSRTAFIITEDQKIYSVASDKTANQLNLEFKNQMRPAQLLTDPKASGHKQQAEKSKVERIREFKEKQKRETAERASKIDFEVSLKTLMNADISVFRDIPISLTMKLYNGKVMTIGDLVAKSRIEIINLDGITKYEVDALTKALKDLNPELTWAMNPVKYGYIPGTKQAKTTTESQVFTTAIIESNAALPLKSDNKDSTPAAKVHIEPSENQMLVRHPLPLTNAPQKKEEDKLSAFPKEKCARCGDLTSLERLNANLHCTSCATIIGRQEAAQKGVSSDGRFRMCSECGKIRLADEFFEYVNEETPVCLSCEQEQKEKEETRTREKELKVEEERLAKAKLAKSALPELSEIIIELVKDKEFKYNYGKWEKVASDKSSKPIAKKKEEAFSEKEAFEARQALENKELKTKFTPTADKDLLAPFEGTLRDKLVDHFIFSLESLAEKSKKDLYFLTRDELSKTKGFLKKKGLSLKRLLPAKKSGFKLKQVGFQPDE